MQIKGTELLGEATAEYILKNRESGWLVNAIHVLESGQFIRRQLLMELRTVIRDGLEKALPDHGVTEWYDDQDFWFSTDMTHEDWADFSVSLANWKWDASEVAIGVYHEKADSVNPKSVRRIQEAMGTQAWRRTRGNSGNWITNVWLPSSDWSKPAFLLRIVEERDGVADEVVREFCGVVERVSDALIESARTG